MNTVIDSYSTRLEALENKLAQPTPDLANRVHALALEIEIFTKNPRRNLTVNEMFRCNAMLIRCESFLQHLALIGTVITMQESIKEQQLFSIT